MELKWTSKAHADLARLYEFLSTVDQTAAARTVQKLAKGPTVLLQNPRIGEQFFQFEPHEVRRIILAQYEIRYEIQEETLYILRLWHTTEQR